MENALQLTRTALTAPTDLKGVFEIAAFRENFINNFQKTTGLGSGAMVFEREKILFMKALAENRKIEQCDRFSIYAAFIELAVSGLTLNEGISYIIPYKDRAAFQIGWRGRLEQISQMPEINFVPPPEVVLTNELNNFDYELGENPRVVRHKPAKDRTITKDNRIEFVYLILDTKFGKRTFVMSRQEVLQIRDTYSIGYKYYMSKGGKYDDGKPIEIPFWISNEAEAFKKTIVKRAYKYLPKTPRQKILDEKIATAPDVEDGIIEASQQAIDYGISGAQDNDQARPGQDKAEAQIVNQAPTQAEPVKEKAKRSHKKKTEAETVTTPDGTTAEVATGEVITGGVSDGPTEDNPVDGLPDLDNLD